MELRASAGMCGVCAGVCECVWVCAGMRGCARVCAGVRRCARVCAGVRGCAQMCGYAWVWDIVFSEFLLENRVPTSADSNTFPIRIFFFQYLYELLKSCNTFG